MYVRSCTHPGTKPQKWTKMGLVIENVWSWCTIHKPRNWKKNGNMSWQQHHSAILSPQIDIFLISITQTFQKIKVRTYLRRLVSWINHLPPACWSTFWKSIFKHQLGCRFDILDSISSFFGILTYATICLDTSYHFWLYLYFLNVLYFSSTPVLTSSIDVVFVLSIRMVMVWTDNLSPLRCQTFIRTNADLSAIE